MNLLHRAAAGATLVTAIALPSAAQAGNVEFFAPFGGSGNLVVFDPAAGSGGWVGQLSQTPPPEVPNPLSLVSVVLFDFDLDTLTLSGSFEFTDAADLGSTLFGTLGGSTLDAGFLSTGGALGLEYTIRGGTGRFGDAAGFGLSFLRWDPAGGGLDNYAETGLLSFAVPEPGSLLLAALALLPVLALSAKSRRQPGQGAAAKLAG